MNKEKILEQFHYFNIQSDVDSVYGNWAVSKDGDVVNCLYPNAILAIHLEDADWLEKIHTKVWFKSECEEALRKALERAKKIISNVATTGKRRICNTNLALNRSFHNQ